MVDFINILLLVVLFELYEELEIQWASCQEVLQVREQRLASAVAVTPKQFLTWQLHIGFIITQLRSEDKTTNRRNYIKDKITQADLNQFIGTPEMTRAPDNKYETRPQPAIYNQEINPNL